MESSSAWRSKTRHALLAEIRQSDVWKYAPEKRFTAPKIFDVLSFSSAKELFKPFAIGTLIFAVISTSSLATVQAAKASLPGDALYSVKLGIEHAQVILASSENKKAELEVGFAATRLQEVGEIVASENTDETAEKVTTAMTRFNEDLSSVQNRLEKLGNNVETASQALEVSKLVNESTQAIEESLRDIKIKIEQKNIQIDALEKADSNTNEATTTSTAVGSTKVDIAQKANTQIATSSTQVSSSTPEKTDAKKDASEQSTNTDLLKTLDTAITTVDQVNTKSLEVFVDKVRSSSDEGLKADAVDKLQKKIQKIEKDIIATEQKIEAVTQQAKDAKVDQATTTPSLIIKKDDVSVSTPALANPKTDTASSTLQEVIEQASKDASAAIDKTISDVQEKPVQAKESIEQAKKILNEQGGEDLSGILQKVKDAKEIVKEADKTIKQVVDTIATPATQSNADNNGKILGEQVRNASTTPIKAGTEKNNFAN